MSDQKQCIRCDEIKNLVEFSKGRSWCLPCHKTWNQEYYRANRDQIRSKSKIGYADSRTIEENRVISFTGPTLNRPVTNLTGHTFGSLLVLGYYGRIKWRQHGWLCLCTCKRIHITTGGHLMNGKVKSCGCRGIMPGQCTNCYEVKSLDQFPIDDRNKSGHHSWCKVCLGDASKAWSHRNLDRIARRQRELYHSSEEYREKRNIKSKAFAYKRRAILKNTRCDLTAAQWRAIKAAYRHLCAYCGERKPLTQDHVIPVSKGGEHTASNIVPACQGCNSSKGAGLPQVVYQQHLLVSEVG